jgi:hypothetical protein
MFTIPSTHHGCSSMQNYSKNPDGERQNAFPELSLPIPAVDP